VSQPSPPLFLQRGRADLGLENLGDGVALEALLDGDVCDFRGSVALITLWRTIPFQV